MATILPPLPDLPNDGTLEVLTHPSLAGLGFPDNSKLAVVGLPYTKAVICHVLIATKPELSAHEIEVSIVLLLQCLRLVELTNTHLGKDAEDDGGRLRITSRRGVRVGQEVENRTRGPPDCARFRDSK